MLVFAEQSLTHQTEKLGSATYFLRLTPSLSMRSSAPNPVVLLILASLTDSPVYLIQSYCAHLLSSCDWPVGPGKLKTMSSMLHCYFFSY